MELAGGPLYISAADKIQVQQNLVGYLNNALTDANNYVVGTAAGNVPAWFGAVTAPQKVTLAANLTRMVLVLNNFAVGGKTHVRKVQLSQSSGSELHDSGQVGAAYTLGVTNVNSHFTLRVYVGLAFRNANYDTKVQTIIHELSHRVLQTADEQNGACGGVDGTKCYGRANAAALAAASSAQALNNADSFGYYVCACNNLNPT